MVLKPLDVLPDELTWLQQFASMHPVRDFRMSVPLAGRGRLVVDGWTAFPFSRESIGRAGGAEIATVARAITKQFDGVERPAFLDDRTHAWARADRLAWGEGEPIEVDGAPFLAHLLTARRAVSDQPGIIHGDLSGNVLFYDETGPAVIDFTAYWRPFSTRPRSLPSMQSASRGQRSRSWNRSMIPTSSPNTWCAHSSSESRRIGSTASPLPTSPSTRMPTHACSTSPHDRLHPVHRRHGRSLQGKPGSRRLGVGRRGRPLVGRLDSAGTNNIGELLAVLYAVHDHAHVQNLVIQADSRYAIDTYSSWMDAHRRRGWKTSTGEPTKNVDILRRLIEVRTPAAR